MFIICLLINFLLIVFTKCVNNQTSSETSSQKDTAFKPQGVVGFNSFSNPVICASCHQEIYSSFLNTSHYTSSQIADERTIAGSLKKSNNFFQYEPGKLVVLKKQENSLYQVYYHNGKEIVKRKIDIIIGSGTKGQTYLSWLDNHLIELPVSYFTQVYQWANSPGYPRSPIIFNRPVTTRCLECHSTFAETINYNPNKPPAFDSSKMILRIGCEKCHGPAARHVAYQTKNPSDKNAKFIVNPKKLPKLLALDVCGLCHAGVMQEKTIPFQFTAGKQLSDFFQTSDAAKKTSVMDVHGNQLGILSASKCFRISKNMTCNTCHDPHLNERGKVQIFSQRCKDCHANEHAKIEGVSANLLSENCIDCHMPLQESTSISFILEKKSEPVNAVMRTHFIKVYAEETKKFIQQTAAAKTKNK
jgi:hypothetical protein